MPREPVLACIGELCLCRHGICESLIKPDQPYGALNTVSKRPFGCGGSPKRCVIIRKAGENCTDANVTRASGLVCVDNPCVKVICEQGNCDGPNTVCQSEKELVCEGSLSKRCDKSKGFGQECGRNLARGGLVGRNYSVFAKSV